MAFPFQVKEKCAEKRKMGWLFTMALDLIKISKLSDYDQRGDGIFFGGISIFPPY